MFGMSKDENIEKAKRKKLGWVSPADLNGIKKPNTPDQITMQDGDVFQVMASDYVEISPIPMCKGDSLRLSYTGEFINTDTGEKIVYKDKELHSIEVDDDVVINGSSIFTATSIRTGQRMLGALLTEKMK